MTNEVPEFLQRSSNTTIKIVARPKIDIPFEQEHERIRQWAQKIAESIDNGIERNVQIRKNRKRQLNRLVIKLTNFICEYQEMSFQGLIEKLTVIDSLIKVVYLKSYCLRGELLYGDIDLRELSPGEALDKIMSILPDNC